MIILDPPLRKYLSGKLPTHSSTQKLSDNFDLIHPNAILHFFLKAGYMNENNKPTKKALSEGLIESCERKALWNLDKVSEKLSELGLNVERKYVNQEIAGLDSMEPKWVNLGTIGTYFNTTANTIGKWLDELELRDNKGMGNATAVDMGLTMITEMSLGGKKTRKISLWNLVETQKILLEAGHPLDFDYEKSLKGNGKNSDVTVTTLDDRAQEFAKEFVTAFKNKEDRRACYGLVKKQSPIVLEKAENILKRPGFFTQNKYQKYIK